MMKKNKIIGGLLGLCIGDALGVPVEFNSRDFLKSKPITDMTGYGTYFQPPGTWSDDSSLTFCLTESLCNGLNLQDIADKFVKWLLEGYWTPYGDAFDVGNTTQKAIYNLKDGINPLKAGLNHERSNGNGSLMRILPIAFYVEKLDITKQFEYTHQISCITHRHLRSQMACGIYIQFLIRLLKGDSPQLAYKNMRKIALEYYSNEPYSKEIHHFDRILKHDISELSEDSIKSNGYVIDTLEASIWAFLRNKTYKDTVLTAVNLGGDTDTIGAVAGGISGVYYGYENIPIEWINKIPKVEKIIELGEKYSKSLQ